MKDTVIIAVVALICITIIVVAGVAMGHNDALLSGALATIAGIAASFGAYNAAKTNYTKWHNDRLAKEAHQQDQSTPPKQDQNLRPHT